MVRPPEQFPPAPGNPPHWYSPPPLPPPQPKGGSARTGPLPLHPMTVGDILDGAFKLLKANIRTIVIVAGAFVVPVALISAVFTQSVSTNPFDAFTNPAA